MAISTNGTVIARLAGGLYNTVISNATYLEVAAQDPSTLANTLYARDFAKSTDLAVAQTLTKNLGLSTVAGLDNWVAAQLTAAGAANKGAKIVSLLNDFAGLTADTTYGAAATAFNTKVDAALAASQKTGSVESKFEAAGVVAVANATFTLTSGVDTFVGGAGNDTFVGNTSANALAFTSLDSLTGGAGTDTLNITVVGALDLSGAAATKVEGIENTNLVSSAAVTADVSTWTDLTAMSSTGVGGATLTAGAASDVTVTDGSLTNNAIAVDGGKNIVVAASGTTTGTIAVGATTAPAGTVAVTGAVKGVGAVTQGAIGVTGGTSVSVTTTATQATLNTTATQAAVTVTGKATTTDVTVTQTAPVTAAADTYGIANGAVTVNDVNRASATKAGSITSVTLNNFGAATINSGALTTVTLSGKGTSVDASTLGALTTPANTSLALNVNTLTTTGAVTVDSDITTLNITSSTKASTIASLVAGGATAVNIAGDAALTLTAQTLGALKTVTVTNTAGANLGTELATGVTFTGGAGADTVKVAATTKAINLGAGNDVAIVSVTALGSGGSLNGGDGTDTLVANTNGSNLSSDPAFGSFETLRVAGAAAQGSHNANGFTALEVGALAGAATFTNVAAGVGLTVLAAPTAATTVTLANATGKADSFGLTLSSAAAMNANSITLAGIETITVNTVDTSATSAQQDTLTLVATSATKLVVAGNAGLALTNTGNTKITSFDASGVTGAAADSASLAVTFTSANTTVGETISITGGSGDDSLTGGSATNDTINGGAGVDTITYNGGSDVFTGGAGKDAFVVSALGTSTVYLTIADLTAGDTINVTGVATNGTATFTTTKIALGAAATLAQYLAAAAAGDGSTNSAATWFQYGGDTYLVTDNTVGSSFAATDGVVKITGAVDLSSSTIAAGVITVV